MQYKFIYSVGPRKSAINFHNFVKFHILIIIVNLRDGMPQIEYSCSAFYLSLKYCVDGPMMVAEGRNM
jgi:hypothetical protein